MRDVREPDHRWWLVRGLLNGGLELAVHDVWPNARPAWFAQYDPEGGKRQAPSRILAHHWPDVPNHGDVTAIDWSTVQRVHILTGGFPCTDVSSAGLRGGLQRGQNRSGLWAHMAVAIDALRPPLVIIENVRGLLSAKADSDVEQCAWCVGGPADGEPALRALGAVLGDLADIGYDAQWVTLPASGVGAPHRRERVFVLAWPAADASRDGRDEGWAEPAWLWRRSDAPERGAVAAGLTLLPTPTAQVGINGGTQHPDKRRDGGHTPTIADITEHLLPTPRSSRGASGTETMYALGGERLDDERPQGVVLMPTPSVADVEGGRKHRSGDRSGELLLNGIAAAQSFGPYAAAVARWEAITRPAPGPTEPTGKGGAHRLSPRFVEWMQGLPDGWVTDVPGITRNDMLKALGNGVVPQQAAEGIRWVLDHLDAQQVAS